MSRAEALRRWAEANGYGERPTCPTGIYDSPAACDVCRGDIDTCPGSVHETGYRESIPDTGEPIVIDIETTGKTPWTGELICAGVGGTAYRGDEGRRLTRQVLARPGIVVCHTAFDLRWLALDGAELHPDLQFHDTRVMAWLLDETGSNALDDLCDRWLGYRPPKVLKRVAGRLMFEARSGELVPIAEAPWDEMRAYNESDLRSTAELYERLRVELEAEGLWELFLRDEVPLVRCLLDMETAGLPIDEANLGVLQERVRGERDELARKLLEAGGLPPSFNLGSSQQVGTYLFSKGLATLGDRLELDPAAGAIAKATKTVDQDPVEALNASGLLPENFTAERVGRFYVHGHWRIEGRGLQATLSGTGRPSTSSIPLVLSNPRDEWVADFVLWRELSKLDSAFLARFPAYMHKGRLHGTINRTGTATGRFSASEPNLQQVPAHGAYGAHVRALFSGPLVVGDYSQLEQRVAAHYSRDENLLKAYHEGVDLYGLAAATLFGGEASKQHPQRGLMKTGMLALQYGAGPGKLAQLMLVDGHEGATKARAKELIEQLQAVFPRFFEWREEVIQEAAARGYVETLGGRRRRLAFPRDWTRRRRRRFFGGMQQEAISRGYALERQAINALCQGGAADIVARAMVEARRRVRPEQARLLLQVHDEILWERGPEWDAECLATLREACERGHGFDLVVPLEFAAKPVESWAEKGGGASGMSSLLNERMQRSRAEGMQSRKAADLARVRA